MKLVKNENEKPQNNISDKEAEDAFNESLGDFDQIMGAEREQMAAQGIGSAADEVFREAGSIGGNNPGSGTAEGQEQTAGGTTGGDTAQSGSRGAPVFGPSEPPQNSTAPQVEGCEDDDTVARQLCEAATDEEDPFLRAALWDEYNEYKRILARQ